MLRRLPARSNRGGVGTETDIQTGGVPSEVPEGLAGYILVGKREPFITPGSILNALTVKREDGSVHKDRLFLLREGTGDGEQQGRHGGKDF